MAERRAGERAARGKGKLPQKFRGTAVAFACGDGDAQALRVLSFSFADKRDGKLTLELFYIPDHLREMRRALTAKLLCSFGITLPLGMQRRCAFNGYIAKIDVNAITMRVDVLLANRPYWY